ncbi:hypothetical protein KIL84_003434 [Mauremys mutica]|uniref:Uncharacterized protein n=1 Tax=Mauremys mutica TaxID=74926 RepID=A0A9D3WVN7_9SAUR|nr:hypothetical protein KIL84_003434 [Mauremys mutica]
MQLYHGDAQESSNLQTLPDTQEKMPDPWPSGSSFPAARRLTFIALHSSLLPLPGSGNCQHVGKWIRRSSSFTGASVPALPWPPQKCCFVTCSTVIPPRGITTDVLPPKRPPNGAVRW